MAVLQVKKIVIKETTDDTKQQAQQIEKPGEFDETRNKNNRKNLFARNVFID